MSNDRCVSDYLPLAAYTAALQTMTSAAAAEAAVANSKQHSKQQQQGSLIKENLASFGRVWEWLARCSYRRLP